PPDQLVYTPPDGANLATLDRPVNGCRNSTPLGAVRHCLDELVKCHRPGVLIKRPQNHGEPRSVLRDRDSVQSDAGCTFVLVTSHLFVDTKGGTQLLRQ